MRKAIICFLFFLVLAVAASYAAIFYFCEIQAVNLNLEAAIKYAKLGIPGPKNKPVYLNDFFSF